MNSHYGVEAEHHSARSIRGYLPTLDGWRAVAITAVMISHIMFSKKYFYELGNAGVSIFFAISGFLICSRLLEEYRRNGRINLASFYVRRIFRIMPPYLIYLAAIAILAYLGYRVASRQELIACLFFARNYLPSSSNHHIYTYTGHFWSLAVEEHFYLIFPGLLVLWGIPRARWWSAALALAVIVWRCVDIRFHIFKNLFTDIPPWSRTDFRLDGILWGCVAALWLRSESVRVWLTRRLTMSVWLLLLTLFLASSLGLVRVRYASIIVPIVSPFLIVGTVLRPESLPGTLLERPLIRWVGKISYSLYLWQQLFLIPQVDHVLPGSRMAYNLPWNIAVVFVFASISYYIVELPMIRLGHAIASRSAPSWPSKEKRIGIRSVKTASSGDDERSASSSPAAHFAP